MLPIVLVAKNKDQIKNFLADFIKAQGISKHSVFETFPLKKEVLISQIREIRKEIMLASTSVRLFILYHFDKATMEAQNALLKSLEETGIKNQFILVATNEHLILPTILSRSKIVRPSKNSLNDAKIPDSNVDLLKNIENSTNYNFLSNKKLSGMTKEEVVKFFEELVMNYRSKLASDPLSAKIIIKALQLKALLENNNLNPQLTLDYLLIFINKAFKMKR